MIDWTLEATSVEIDRSIVSRERSLLGLNGRAEVEKSTNRLASIRDRLGANAVPVQIPIGQEDTFTGVIDLVENNAIIYRDDQGKQIDVVEIPAELGDLAAGTELWAQLLRLRMF